MISLPTWILWVHLLGASAWLGGAAVLLAAILPGKGDERTEMARRAHFLTSRAMEVVVLTGVINILVHGWETGLIYSAAYFGMLSVKMALLVVMAGLQVWMGAAWRRAGAGDLAARRARLGVSIQLALGAAATLLGMGIRTV
jgi:putative copper export protein